jgi:uncharacterized protein (UPF0548 family)
MKVSILMPNEKVLKAYIAAQAHARFSYSEVGRSSQAFPEGYDHDYNRVLIGEGGADFQLAKALVSEWKMFSTPWTRLYPDRPFIEEGLTVSVLFRLFGTWWFNSCRVVYTIDTPTRFGFAYGTLEGHVECGEERFMVYMDESDKVWYSIEAFSRPGTWYTQIASPIARRFQKRFVKDSFRAMQLSMYEKKKHEVV